MAPVKMHRGEPVELEVAATPLENGVVTCTLSSTRTLRTGRVQTTTHFSCEVLTSGMIEVSALPSSENHRVSINKEQIYQRFFHGPCFQVLNSITAADASGLVANGAVDHTLIANDLIVAPLLLESAFQAAGLHAMINDGALALPSSFESMVYSEGFEPNTPIELQVARRGDLWDVDLTQGGKRILTLRGYAMAQLGPLPESDRFKLDSPEDGGSASGGTDLSTDKPNGFMATIASSSIVSPPVATPEVSFREVAQLCNRGTPKRQAERVAGRVAAKRAIAELTGAKFSQIEIHNLDSGEPVATIDGAVGPNITISHSGEMAVAAAHPNLRIGIDLEHIEQRHPSFQEEWFCAQELKLIAGDPEKLTLAWAAKEAVLKSIGQGMASNPREIAIRTIDAGKLTVSLTGGVASIIDSMSLSRLDLTWRKEGERVLVLAQLAA